MVKDGDFFVCQGCGTKYTVEQARNLMQPDNAAAAPAAGYAAPAAGYAPAQATAAGYAPAPGYAPGQAPAGYVPNQVPPAGYAPGYAPAQTASGGYALGYAPVQGAPTGFAPGPVGAPVAAAVGQGYNAFAGQMLPPLNTTADFNPSVVNVMQLGPLNVNNYACRAWELFLAEYKAIEHPTAERQQELADRARECLTLLGAAGLYDSNAHEQDLLIYKNCLEIIESAKDTYYYEEKEEGKFSRRSMPLSTKFDIPAMTDSWEGKRNYHQDFLSQEFFDANPQIVARQQELAQREAELDETLGDLKDEKKAQGFFNFSGKREVKERMAPYREELGQINREQDGYEKQARDYAEDKLRTMCSQFTRFYAD